MARILLLLVLFFSAPVWAQQLEVIPLKSKTAEDVLPVLLPLVEPGGTLTGLNDQLFLRASARNRADIKRALAALDKPTRRLIIHVAQNRQAEESTRGVEARGQVVLGSTRRANVGARVWDSRSGRDESGGQMVQTVEGGQAFIQIGRSLPLPMRQIVLGPGGAVRHESVVYRDVGRGFYAVPRVNGQRVTVEISQQAEQMVDEGRGRINSQRLSTTVSGRLGEWIELGGGERQAAANEDGAMTRSTNDARDHHAVWLMVEEAD